MTSNKPLVSIGVPVYNGEPFIREALDSLLGQSYEKLEIVISDNTSTDNTEAICLEYAARDRRIRYYRNAIHTSAPANFRRVFDLSTGEYFMWTAADDIRPPDAVKNCLDTLLKNDRAVMAHGTILIKVEGRNDLVEVSNDIGNSGLGKKATERVRAFTKGIAHNAMNYGLYRRAALEKAKFTDYWGADYLLCLQLYFLGPVEYVKTPIIVYRKYVFDPTHSPMGSNVRLTPRTLLTSYRGSRKRWAVLLLGCYYLMALRGVSLQERVGGTVSHILCFARRFGFQMAKDLVFLLFTPAAWLTKICLILLAQVRESLLRA